MRMRKGVDEMAGKNCVAIAGILLILLLGGCKNGNKEELGIKVVYEAEYICLDQSRIEARYFSLTDDSLNFVKIKMPDGEKHTLPQVIAASGARYSDEHSIQFWIKGNAMTLYAMGEEDEWKKIKEGMAKE